jgi:UDP-N-acetylmuramate dehydrogenase
MNQSDKDWLTERFGTNVLLDEPMWRHTTLRTGGPVDALVSVKTEQEIRDVVLWADDKNHPIMILGEGTNLLVRDGGVRGLILRLADDFEAIQLVSEANDSSATVNAGAAVLVRRLGKYALDQGLSGFNFALGIPGTVGGALLTNAGAWGRCMADSTSSIRVLDQNGEITSLHRDQLQFSYRRLDLGKRTIVLSGQFKLKRTDRETLQEEAIRLQKKRRLSQPLALPSAGCVFQNPQGQKSAGELIDQAGLKGLSVGEAEVSTKHANFIVNKGHAKASDVIDLMKQIQESVFEGFGVNLEPEVTIVGQEKDS